MEQGKGTVCVTGGTGYVASWLVMRLLQHGYTVRATVRSHPAERKKDITYLTSLPGAAERLQIFNADLELPDSFSPAIEGCTGVFHVAHPMEPGGREEDRALNQKALRGTLGVLRACVAAKTVGRVVYTSSTLAVTVTDAAEDEEVVDESAWTDAELVKKVKPYAAPYTMSKVVCERAAMEFAEENGLHLVSLNPSLIGGPFITPRIPGSVRVSMALIFGTFLLIPLISYFYDVGDAEAYEYLLRVSLVHIDDVATAFILLYEHPHAHGRYNCSAIDVTLRDLSKFISEKYPEFPIPSPDALNDVEGFKPKYPSSKKILDLGFKFKHGLHEIYNDQIKCCMQKGLLK